MDLINHPIHPIHKKMSHHWESSLCGCLDNCGVCLCVFCCPLGFCCIHLKVAGKASGGCCGPYCRVLLCHYFGFAMNRKRIRHEVDVKGSFWGDCCTWLYCAPCAASQEFREWKVRGKHNPNHS
jgi:Cys-rich protein (TIGR01571 family)